MDSDLNNQNDQWELNLDIDYSDLILTPVLRPCSSTHVETSTITQNPVSIIPGPAGILQAAKLLKQTNIQDGGEGCVMSTQEYIKKVVEDVGEDEDFKSGSWVSVTNYVNANGGIVSGCLRDIKNFLKNEKHDQIVAIVKPCSPNVISDLTMTLKDLSSTIPGTIHHKVIDEGGYGKDITVEAALILANVSFSGSGVGGSGMLMEEEEMADLELQVCGNVIDQEMADEEALNFALEEEARQARAEHEWLEKFRQEEELVADSSRLQDRIKVWFVQKRAEEEAFSGFLHDQCASLKMTNNKNQRLIAELEALGERGDVVRCLDHMREIVARDSVKLRILKQLLAGTHVETGLKDSYVADMEENE
ncbi:hypothetical protein Tco_0617467 [Tanacetum coccineum]